MLGLEVVSKENASDEAKKSEMEVEESRKKQVRRGMMMKKLMKKVAMLERTNKALQMKLNEKKICESCLEFRQERDFLFRKCKNYERQLEKQSEAGERERATGTAEKGSSQANQERNVCTVDRDTQTSEEFEGFDLLEPKVEIVEEPFGVNFQTEVMSLAERIGEDGSAETGPVKIKVESEKKRKRVSSHPDVRPYVGNEVKRIFSGSVTEFVGRNQEILECGWVQNGKCARAFSEMSAFVSHVNQEHVPRSQPHNYACFWENCPRKGLELKSAKRLVDHLNVHTVERPFKCTYDGCRSSFSKESELLSHQYGHVYNKVPCRFPGCPKLFTTRRSAKRHYHVIHTGKVKGPDLEVHACMFTGCGRTFETADILRDHVGTHLVIAGTLGPDAADLPEKMRKFPVVEKAVDCMIKVGQEHSGGPRHAAKEDPKKKKKLMKKGPRCRFPGCNSRFETHAALKDHGYSHITEKALYKCKFPGCPYVCRDHRLLRIHLRTHKEFRPKVRVVRPEGPEDPVNSRQPQEEVTGPLVVLELVLNEPRESEESAAEVQVGDVGGEGPEDPGIELQPVTNNVEERCPLAKGELLIDVTGYDEGPREKPAEDTAEVKVCRWVDWSQPCGYEAKEPKDFISHVKRQHEDGKVCRWQGCPRDCRPFGSRWQLCEHLRKHTGEKPFVCPVPSCRKAFAMRSYYNDHMVTHTNRRFACPHEGCDRHFSRMDTVHAHYRTQHLGDERFKCPFPNCGKIFTKANPLKKHVAIHASRSAYSCQAPECGASFFYKKEFEDHSEKHQLDGCTFPSIFPDPLEGPGGDLQCS